MSKYTLPTNCRIELLRPESKTDRAFILVFEAENGDDYRSEVYYPAKGQRLKAAAWEVCQRYDWHEFPPATGVLTKEELEKLYDMVEDAIYDMDARPERYIPDPEKFWEDCFSWADREFYADGDDLLGCGDPPIPSYDDDLEDEWTAYYYIQDQGRGIAAKVRELEVTKGPRGVEMIRFHSGDLDGNWDVDAEFVRIQPGAKVTKADKKRLELARGNLDRTSDARTERQIAALIIDEQEECWDPEDFRYHAIRMNCYWALLRYKRYQIWCAIHGKDPLGNVFPEHESVDVTYDVTARVKQGKTVTEAVCVRGTDDETSRKEAIRYLGGHTVEELKDILKEFPEGRPLGTEGERSRGWIPGKATLASITFQVTIKERRPVPITPHHIRQVSCKGLAEDVKRLLHDLERHYPEPT